MCPGAGRAGSFRALTSPHGGSSRTDPSFLSGQFQETNEMQPIESHESAIFVQALSRPLQSGTNWFGGHGEECRRISATSSGGRIKNKI